MEIKKEYLVLVFVVAILIIGGMVLNKNFFKKEISETPQSAFGYDTSFPLLGPDSSGDCDANCQCKKKCDKEHGDDANYDDLELSEECKQSLEDNKDELKNKCEARCDNDDDDDEEDCKDDCEEAGDSCEANCEGDDSQCISRCSCREDNCNTRCEDENDGEGEDDDESEESCTDEIRDEEEEISDCVETTSCTEEECEQVVNGAGDEDDGDGDEECNEDNDGELCYGEVDGDEKEICAVCIGGKCTSNSAPHEGDEFSENDDSFLQTIPEYDLGAAPWEVYDYSKFETRHYYLEYTTGLFLDSDYITDTYPLEEGCTCEDECRERYDNCIGDDTDSEGNSCSNWRHPGQPEDDCFAQKTECLLECDTPEREETSFENFDCSLNAEVGKAWEFDGTEWKINTFNHDPPRILSETEEESCENIKWGFWGNPFTYSMDELPVLYLGELVVADDGNVEDLCLNENTKKATIPSANILCPSQVDDYFKGFVEVRLDISTPAKACYRDATIIENGEYKRKKVLCLKPLQGEDSYCEGKTVCSEFYDGEGQPNGGYVPCNTDLDCETMNLGTCTENLGLCKPMWLGFNDNDDFFPGAPDSKLRVELDFGDVSFSPELPEEEQGITEYELKIIVEGRSFKTTSGGEETFYETATPIREVVRSSFVGYNFPFDNLRLTSDVYDLIRERTHERDAWHYRSAYDEVIDEITIKVVTWTGETSQDLPTFEIREKITIIDPHWWSDYPDIVLFDEEVFSGYPSQASPITLVMGNANVGSLLAPAISKYIDEEVPGAIIEFNEALEPITEVLGDVGTPQIERTIQPIVELIDPDGVEKSMSKIEKYPKFIYWGCLPRMNGVSYGEITTI